MLIRTARVSATTLVCLSPRVIGGAALMMQAIGALRLRAIIRVAATASMSKGPGRTGINVSVAWLISEETRGPLCGGLSISTQATPYTSLC